MKKLINFNDFLFDSVLENKFQVSFTLTERLYELLEDIYHPISRSIRDLDDDNYLNDKVTLLDYDDKDYTKFTYTIPNKLVDTLNTITNKDKEEIKKEISDRSSRYIYGLISKYGDQGLMGKNRTSTTINKVVNKLFPGKYDASGNPGEDLESFREMVVSKRKELDKALDRFKVVDGDDIIKYYNQRSYSSISIDEERDLFKSCMRHDYCEDYLNFYSKNDGVKLVVLFSEEEPEKIDGRALLWDIDEIDGKQVDRKFMDRIYFTYTSDVQLFKNYAMKNEWLNKFKQNMQNDEKIEDLSIGDSGYWTLKTKNTFEKAYTYPYMDTMKFFHHEEGFLTNDEDYYHSDFYILEDTRGGYDGGGIYVDWYGESYPEEDLIFCDLGDDYRLHDDAYFIESEKSYATETYLNNHFMYSEIYDEYIREEDAIYSEYAQSYVPVEETHPALLADAAEEDSYEDVVNSGEYEDYVLNDHLKDFIEYDTGDESIGHLYFNFGDRSHFIKAYSTLNKEMVNAHKRWDKDKIKKINDKYYLFDGDQKEIDRIIGQHRLFDNKKNII